MGGMCEKHKLGIINDDVYCQYCGIKFSIVKQEYLKYLQELEIRMDNLREFEDDFADDEDGGIKEYIQMLISADESLYDLQSYGIISQDVDIDLGE